MKQWTKTTLRDWSCFEQAPENVNWIKSTHAHTRSFTHTHKYTGLIRKETSTQRVQTNKQTFKEHFILGITTNSSRRLTGRLKPYLKLVT